jgi:ComF family protein
MDLKGVLFPRRCPICDKILKFDGELICKECKNKLVYIIEPRCKKCGKQLDKPQQEYCYDCKEKEHLYKMGIAGFSHVGEIKKSIYDIKYSNRREYVDFYVNEMCKFHKRQILDWGCEGLIPVPLHYKRKIKRGYNQAEVIARAFSKELGIKVYNNGLKRVKNTKPQKELNDIERRKNLENAFEINKKNSKVARNSNITKLKKVILIDDIYTTGTTIDACTKELLQGGIEEVYYLSLSIGTGY